MMNFQERLFATILVLVSGFSCTAPEAELEQQPQALSKGPGRLELTQVGMIGPGGRIAPRFSPDGGWLLVSGPSYEGLYRLNFDGSEEQLTDAQWGYWARFSGSEIVTVDADGVQWSSGPDGWQSTGECEPSQTAPDSRGVVYVQRDDTIVALVGGTARVVMGREGHRYFRPRLSPNGRRLLVQELSTGMRVLELEGGQEVLMGAGSNPVWFPDSRRILFNRSQDDGIRITASELYVYDIEGGSVYQLTDTPERHEIQGTVSPDGGQIAFEAGLRIYRGILRQHPLVDGSR